MVAENTGVKGKGDINEWFDDKIQKEEKKYEDELLERIEQSRLKIKAENFINLLMTGARPFKPRTTICKDTEGNILTKKKDIYGRNTLMLC